MDECYIHNGNLSKCNEECGLFQNGDCGHSIDEDCKPCEGIGYVPRGDEGNEYECTDCEGLGYIRKFGDME